MITSLLLALAPAVLQTPTAPQTWELVDGVAAHIGNRIISLRELDALVQANLPNYPQLSEAQLTVELLREMENRLLEIQAGEDSGFDRALIANIATQQTLDNVEDLGSAQFSDQLRRQGSNIADMSSSQADDIYSQLWSSKQLGTDLGFTDRVFRDRYIRPGMLKSIFLVNRDMLFAGTVEMRYYVMDAMAVGGVHEDAIEWIEGIKARVAGGEDFAEIVRLEATQNTANGGLQPPAPIPSIPFPQIREFASTGKVGDFAPIVRDDKGPSTVYLLARLESRKDQVVPHFEDGNLQNKFRTQLRRDSDTRVLNDAHSRLYRRSHSWIHPSIRQLQESAKAAGKR
jgi:hypothetical protein